MTLFQEGLNGPDPACAADYKKIYSYLTAKVPKVAEMTVGQFLRYVTNTHMKLDDASTDADKRTMAVGKRLAELFFIDTFYPLLKRTGARYETTLLKLRYPEKDKSRKEQ